MSPEDTIGTIPALLQHRVKATPSAIALVEKDTSGKWAQLTWELFNQAVGNLTQRLLQAGLRSGDQVAILMPNAIDWEIIQHAVFRLGGVVIGLDLNDTSQRIDDILELCMPKALFVDCPERCLQISAGHLNAFDLIVSHKLDGSSASKIRMVRLADMPKPLHPMKFRAPDAESFATVIFTSGTTGRPKALWFTHHQIIKAIRSITNRFAALPDQAHTACWLPLANPFQRIINLCAVAANWKCFIVPDPSRIMNTVQEIEPHFFAGVPRFYEKLCLAIESGIRQKPLWQKALATWAIDMGRSVAGKNLAGITIPLHLRWMHRAAEYLVLKNIRRVMGKQLEFFISGSAPLSKEMITTCYGLGWTIIEAYGISENIAPMAMNAPGAKRAGSVGRPLPENIIKIGDDGEILVKSDCLAANVSPRDHDGFYATGDLGRMDAEGYLWLTGRKNDTFKLSTGRKIIPQAIEAAITRLEGVEHALAVGHNRKYVIALLNVPGENWRRLTARHGGEEKVRAFLNRQVHSVCSHLPRYCQPADIMIVNDCFSSHTGELTTNFKLRRSAVLSKYASGINACYQEIDAG